MEPRQAGSVSGPVWGLLLLTGGFLGEPGIAALPRVSPCSQVEALARGSGGGMLAGGGRGIRGSGAFKVQSQAWSWNL